MVLKGLKEYFSACPLLSGRKITTDFLSENAPAFAIYSENSQKSAKKYISGDCLFSFTFSFRARLYLGKKEAENEKVSKFFEDLSDWIKSQVLKGILPDLGKDKVVQNLEVITQPHIKNTNISDCVYEMKLKVIYYKRR